MSDGMTEAAREEFKVGDRVKYVGDDFSHIKNKTGIIAEINQPFIYVDTENALRWCLTKYDLEKLDDDWNEERVDVIGQNGNIGYSIDEATPQEWDALKSPVSQPIVDACDKIKTLLLEKNRKYGNSALSPKRIFSKSCHTEQLKVRIDDKLSRIANTGLDGADEDTLQDLIGYLILLMVARDA